MPARCLEPMEEVYPTEVRRLPEKHRLRLTWSDGHVAEYDYDYLRGYCPCAGCQGHGTGQVEFRRPASAVEPNAIQPVGNYAISFQWSDGHATGIYRFAFLRQICPCGSCRAARGEEAEPSTTE
ncbi:MAG: DUF971 domain-containing protein [Thermoanaerobaculia bacterium]